MKERLSLLEKKKETRKFEVMKMIKKIEDEVTLQKLAPLFNNWQETMLYSFFKGSFGQGYYVDDGRYASCAIAMGDFYFLAGNANKELVANWQYSSKKQEVIMVPSSTKWQELIEAVYPHQAYKTERYDLKKEPKAFDIEELQSIVAKLDARYTLALIDEALYHQILALDWSMDLCSNFSNYQEYARHGLGFVILENGKIICGASSYMYDHEGMGIEIDCHKQYRHLGLTTICSAKLMLECLKSNKYASWEAYDKRSVALAKKLGHHFGQEHVVYEVTKETKGECQKM